MHKLIVKLASEIRCVNKNLHVSPILHKIVPSYKRKR